MAMYQDIDPINQPNKDPNELMNEQSTTHFYLDKQVLF
ncbi:Uncharacterised protein [Legionella pneumophila]|uniref:Uncharacterized protein n=1 Tax=Legionella pneumophila TaxID=446 RepID=A0A378K9I2_LEGPN|nr:hypothetical protein LPC_1448 [Legionella pneumophila str. Corby]ADG25328.1 hypothetical protein lpa_02869 [Legionella pneumophila 2300/99 Alcoy]MDC7847813.1 hypothetical protein [Legionella pneumophila]WBA03074.1 hypothetical protein LpnA194_01964 [Legionella pneumophila]WBA06230.1 hypothetical protein LpnH3D14_02049 [Legionella pneumophila]